MSKLISPDMVRVPGMLKIGFTGWVDVDLSKKGVEEAEKSGRFNL